MELILFILYTALAAWLIISPLVYIYWHFNRDVRQQYEEHVHAVFLGTLITSTVMIGAGLTQLLVFLPESCSRLIQGGGSVGMPGSIGFTMGLLVAIHLMQSMSKKEAFEDKRRALCHELEVNRRISELDYMNYLKPSKAEDESKGGQGRWADSMVGSPVRRHNMTLMLFQMLWLD